MKFFFDNCMSPVLAKALDLLDRDNSITHLRQRYPEANRKSIPDEKWLLEISKEGDFVVITQDLFTKTEIERRAFREARLTTFSLSKGVEKYAPIRPVGKVDWEMVKNH